MPELIMISPWFYLAGTSVLVWLTACSVLSVIVVLASRLFAGFWRQAIAWTGALLGVVGALACVGMLWVEVRLFEFGEPWCVAAWLLVLASFGIVIRQSRSKRARVLEVTSAIVLASAGFTYLFYFGLIPTISTMPANELADMKGSNVLGQREGTLLITEFADFQCPACAIQDEAMDRLWGTFPGRIQYSFRHLPLRRIHPQAQTAALASQCAAVAGKFWETKRLLFANQERLEAILSQPTLPTIPADAADKYTACMASKSAWVEVQNDVNRAQHLRLRGTPSIVIGDKLIRGMLTYPRLAVIVRHELKARNLLEAQQASTKRESDCGAPVSSGCTAE